VRIIAVIAKRNTSQDWSDDVPFSKPLSQGTATTLITALDPDMPARCPVYLANGQISDTYAYALDVNNADMLWDLSENLVGQKFVY
jgi:hypothetical protein